MRLIINREPPAHKQTDPAKYPGQQPKRPALPTGTPVNEASPSRAYKPVHGGYPG